MAKKNSIKCPFCGTEYLPAEIFFPNEFLGKPRDIIKNDSGELLGFNGSDMNTYETYTCDTCNKEFSVEATVTFKTAQVFDLFAEDEAFKNVKRK